MSNRILVALAFFASSATLFAQATATSTLQGTVYDSSKAVVPNAEVTLFNPATGLRRVESTTDQGAYQRDCGSSWTAGGSRVPVQILNRSKKEIT